jgi:regulator of sigma E protease
MSNSARKVPLSGDRGPLRTVSGPLRMDLLYFVILVSSLIFVHELGHFLFAKAFGVKVLTFSLGFGPKVLRLRGRETEYCVGVLPLGGYVKMLEASKSDAVLPEDRHRTFESLAAYKRVLIVLAGPLMNILFPVLLYFSVFVGDGPFLPPTVGVVLPGHPAEGKLFPGDRVMAVNGEEIGTFDELKRIVAKNPAKPIVFKVFRDYKHIEVEIVATESLATSFFSDAEQRPLDNPEERIGTVGIESSAPAAVLGIVADSPAYRAGLRTFDVVTHVSGRPVERYIDLEAELAANLAETVPVTYLRPTEVDDVLGGLAKMAVFEAGVVALTPLPQGQSLLERTGIELADMYVSQVPRDSYLYRAGLRPGDKILRLDDDEIPAWSTFRERIWAERDRAHRIEFLSERDGRLRSGTFQMRREDFTDEHGQPFARYVFEVRHWVPLSAVGWVEHPYPVRYALSKAVAETIDVTRYILIGMRRLIQGRLSLDSLSGPITIYEVAGEEGRKGTDYFIWVMALISINLGLFNLLPIPVLDGGHLMFLAAEAVMRRPLPLRVREVAHIVGMTIVISLMAVAFKNDLEKRWDVLASQVRELTG